MVALLPNPEPQFCDANGLPYAGGTIDTYVPGTTTLKSTWSEDTGTTLNTNPIVLDSAGRCIIYGDGAYRLILKDADGTLIWDQDSNTLVSAAMAPVVIAATIADAQVLLGIVDEAAALATLTAGLAAEVTRATAAEAVLTAADSTLANAITAEVTRAEAAEAALAASIAALGSTGLKSGTGQTDGTGHVRITYGTPFATATDSAVATISAGGLLGIILSVTSDRFGVDVWSVWSYGTAAPSTGFNYLASGH